LQVEFWYLPHQLYRVYDKKPHRSAWVDATVEDMQAIDRGETQAERPPDRSWMEVPPMPRSTQKKEEEK